MAGRTIEPAVSLLTAGEIRVAVLPVGPVPRDVMDEYLELINRYHHVSLSATRSFYRESPVAQQQQQALAAGASKPPLHLMDWSTSYMHLKFLQSEDARRRTRLPDLHPGRRVLAILGVVYCPMCANVQQAYDEFKKICRSYPEAFVTRCFVFEPSEDHIRQERECQQLADLVMFPPGGPSHLEQHLEVWMHDLAAALLTEFEKWMLTASPSLMKLSGYSDAAEFTGASAVLDEMQKRLAAVDGEMREKQRRGRLMKTKGDMCLLSGSPRDAAEHYRTAQEIAKACSDWVWYGVALEGIAAARIYELVTGSGAGAAAAGLEAVSAGDTGGSNSSSTAAGGGRGGGGGGGGGGGKSAAGRARDGGRGGGGCGVAPGFLTAAKWDLLRRSDAEALVRECFADARAAYKKKGGVAPLQIEQHLKLARLVAGLRGAGARREVSELVAAVTELLPALPVMEDRLVATVECAQVLGMVGYGRKRLLLLWHAMETARSAAACAGGGEKGDLLRIAVRALEPPEDPQAQDPDDLPRTHWSISRAASHRQPGGPPPAGASRGWEAVQTVVLEAALAAAKQAHAPAEAWEASAALLREHWAILTPQYQAALLETLSQASAALTTRQRTRPGLGPGPLVQLKRLLPAALPLQPAPLQLTAAGTIASCGAGAGRGKGGGSGPFIFNPYAAKRQAKQEAGEANATPDWACSDEGRVEVYLVNPLAVPLKIDQLQLHVKYLGQTQQTQQQQQQQQQGSQGAAGAAAGGGSSAQPTQLARGSSGRQPAIATAGGGGGGAYTSTSAGASGTATPLAAHGSTAAAAAAAAAAKAFRTPSLNMVLPPNGRPHRVVLCGKPQLPGTYSVEGCLVTSWGVTWQVPFTVPLKRLAAAAAAAVAAAGGRGGGAAGQAGSAAGGRGGGKSSAAAAAAGGGLSVCVNVLPPLPLVKAIIRAGPGGGPLAPAASGVAAAQPSGAPGPAGPGPGSGQSSSGVPPGQQQPLHLHPNQHPHQQQPAVPQQQQQQPRPSAPDPTVVAVSPRDDDIHASAAHTAFAEDLQRSPPVPVFEGQRLAWSLTLHNQGALPVTALAVLVTNHKGVAVKPLRGAPVPASFQGVHLEVNDTALQPVQPAAAAATSAAAAAASGPTNPTSCSAVAVGAPGGASSSSSSSSSGGALPLRPSGSVTLPLMLAVGQAPRGTFREVSLEVTISYLSKPTDRHGPDDGAPILGRRMTVTLTFEIQPSLCVASTCFLDHFAPLRNGCRLPHDRPLDPRVVVASGGTASAGGALDGVGGEGGGDDDSDSADGASSRSASLVADFSLGRPRFGSLTTFSRTSLGSPSIFHSFAGPLGSGATGGGSSLGLQQQQQQQQQQVGGLGSSALSSRLAGLDLSLGGSRSIRAPITLSLQSSLTSPLSPPGDRPPSWLAAAAAADARDGAAGPPPALLTPQGSGLSHSEAASASAPTGGSPGHPADAAPAAAAAAAARPSATTRSAIVTPEGTGDALGLVTDTVLCVTLRNTSSYYFRAWLARLDDASGPPPLTAAAAAAADCPIEVLQPGDSARLACLLRSAAHAALAALAPADGAAATTTTLEPATAMAAPGGGDVSGTRDAAAPSRAAAAAAASAPAGSSLRCVRLTIQPPGGGAGMEQEAGGAGLGADGAPSGASGGGAAAAVASSTPAAAAGGGAVELAEEVDRMAAAEGLAEEWAVAWELVVGLSEAAAGRAPPRGMVRLAAVDIARSMSATAVQSLRPSTIHFQLQVLPPALPSSCATPCLKDLTYRLRALGLLPPNVAGSVWGLRAHLGEVFRLELLIHNRGNHAHNLTFSVAASPHAAGASAPPQSDFAASSYSQHHHHQHHSFAHPQQQYGYPGAVQPLQGPPLPHLHAASFQGGVPQQAGIGLPYGVPDVRHNHLGRHPRTVDGYTTGGSFVLGGGNPPTAYGRGSAGGAAAAGDSYVSGGGATAFAPAMEPGIDPGVVLVGAVQNIHVTVEPRSTSRHALALTFIHPGLYQLYVYDVCVLPQGMDAHLGGSRPAVQAPQPQPQRIYASVDRLNVLCV